MSTGSADTHNASTAVPYWRLSGFYFFYFCGLGALVPYWSLYLKAEGYGSREIGILAAIIMGTRIIAPNLWGWLGDRSGRRLTIVRWGAALAAIFFSGVIFSGYFWPGHFTFLVLAIIAHSFFWNAILAQFEVITLNHLGTQPQHYSRIRVWGSVGFILTVMALGLLFDIISPIHLPWFVFIFLVLIWICSLLLNETQQHCQVSHWSGFWRIVWKPPVLAFFLAVFLLQLSFGPYYTFFSLLLEQLGYSKSAIGFLWSLGVVAEVLIFMLMHRLLPILGVRLLLLMSLALAFIRWLMIAWLAGHQTGSEALLLLAQCLHAFSFATAHAASIEFIRRYFSGSAISIEPNKSNYSAQNSVQNEFQNNDCQGKDHQGQGQSLFSAVSWGFGGSLGALAAGYLWAFNPATGLQWMFIGAAVVALFAFVAIWFGVKSDDPYLR